MMSLRTFQTIEKLRDFKKEIDSKDAFTQLANEVFDEFSVEIQTPVRKTSTNSNLLVFEEKQKQSVRVMPLPFFQKYLYSIPLFISDKIFKAFDKANPDYLVKDDFIKSLKVLKFGGLDELAALVFQIIDYDSNGVITHYDIQQITSLVLVGQISATDPDLKNTLGEKFYTEFFNGMPAISSSEFTSIIKRDNGSDFFVLIFRYLYDNIPVLRKSLLLHKVKHRSASYGGVGLYINLNSKKANILHKKSEGDTRQIMPRRKDVSMKLGFKKSMVLSPVRQPTSKFKKNPEKPIKIINLQLNEDFPSYEDSSDSELVTGNIKKKSTNKSSLASIIREQMNQTEILDEELSKDIVKLNMSIELEGELYLIQNDGFIENMKPKYLVLLNKQLYMYEITEESYNGSHSLEGCFVKSNSKVAFQGYEFFCFTIYYQNNTTNTFLHPQKTITDKWMNMIRMSINYRNFFDFYALEKEIGTGSFGKVYLAKDIKIGSKVAVKVLNKKGNLKWQNVKTEIDIMKLIKHENIVNFIDNFENSSYYFIVMEYVEHGSLNLFLKNFRLKLTEQSICRIAYKIVSALEYVAKFGIIHRDLKPDNILIGLYNKGSFEDFNIKITDFGFSKILAQDEHLHERCGTIAYSAPEVLLKNPYNNSADIWSFGVCVYYMLSMYIPFKGENNNPSDTIRIICEKEVEFSEIFNSFSPEVINLITNCLIKDPLKRISVDYIKKHPWFEKIS